MNLHHNGYMYWDWGLEGEVGACEDALKLLSSLQGAQTHLRSISLSDSLRRAEPSLIIIDRDTQIGTPIAHLDEPA